MADIAIQPKITRMKLYIPVSPALDHIVKGSVIVGNPNNHDERILCAYEGGIYSKMPFDEKLTIACWRLSDRSPNTAYVSVEPEDITEIGHAAWNPVLRAWTVEDIRAENFVTDWFGEFPAIGGSRDQHSRAARLIVNNGQNIDAYIVYQTARKTGNDPIDAVIEYAKAKR